MNLRNYTAAGFDRGAPKWLEINISFPWRLEIGDDVWIGDGLWILSLARITVESNVCISQRSYFCSGTHDYRKDTFDLITKPIRIREAAGSRRERLLGRV